MLIILIYVVFVKYILIIRSKIMKSDELMYAIVFRIHVALSSKFDSTLIIPSQRHPFISFISISRNSSNFE